MDREQIWAELNAEQREAVGAVRGPVCILAGAGTGKTTTITRRIANQVATGAFDSAAILAVTFTDKAASEMRARLERLGISGVRARTFHSAAYAQLHHLAAEPPGRILPSKALPLRQLANSLPKPYRFRPAGDLATEIEWAKNRRIGPDQYLSRLGSHQPPIPADLMARIFTGYENGKRERGLIDFEDLLELAIGMFQSDEPAREQFAARYNAFTVDEYQDVNLLQETLLREWLGARDDLCVVGDDYQSIYGFTGATPEYLLDMPTRFPSTRVVRLESNYRSTRQVLDLANRLVPQLGGAEKLLRPTNPDGPQPSIRNYSRGDAEIGAVVSGVKALLDAGLAAEDIAVLYRVNYRSEDFEEALAAEDIPFQVKDGAFLNRVTARQMIGSLKRSRSTAVADDVAGLAKRAGYVEDPGDDLGEQELTRQRDMGRFIRLAQEFDDGTRTAAAFVSDIEARFGTEGDGRGVNLLTLHRAKGLEFEAVFLPRLEEGELPFKRARSTEAVAEERRLLYVGITRAKRHLALSWVNDGRRKMSRFVTDLKGDQEPIRLRQRSASAAPRDSIAATIGLDVELSGGFRGTIVDTDAGGATVRIEGGGDMAVAYGERVGSGGRTRPLGPPPDEGAQDTFDHLKRWRLERSKQDGVPAYVIFHDSTLEEIARRRPRSLAELSGLSGIGPTKLDRYGPDVIRVVEKS